LLLRLKEGRPEEGEETQMNDLIVCATDFSPQSEAALAWAAALARRDGGHVDLVHVAPPTREDSRMLVFDAAEFDAEQVRAATEKLREGARAASGEFGVSVRPQLLRGRPHEELLRHAREEDARLVVVGTCGLAAVERWMLGSVAERTVRAADRPVVLVPRPPEAGVWASRGPGGPARAPRVVAALGQGDDVDLLRFVAGLRRGAPADVTFVHLYWPIAEYERLGLVGRRELFGADPDVVASLEPGLRAKISGVPGQGAVALDIRPAWGEPASNLLVAVEEREADLLVVGAHERHGLSRFVEGTLAGRLARQARYVPIAVVPTEVRAAHGAPAVPRIRTVLAATDLSPLGNAAVAHAYALLRGTGGVVELCTIHERALPNPAYAYDALEGRLTDLERAKLTKDLRALVPAEAKSLGIATHVTVVDGGAAAEAIVQAAERLHVDVISLASHGRGGIVRAVMGSVAQDVVHRARRPVFVVRGP
jgi:nucleotide-binding universal stress UspA family protein